MRAEKRSVSGCSRSFCFNKNQHYVLFVALVRKKSKKNEKILQYSPFCVIIAYVYSFFINVKGRSDGYYL